MKLSLGKMSGRKGKHHRRDDKEMRDQRTRNEWGQKGGADNKRWETNTRTATPVPGAEKRRIIPGRAATH